MGVTQLWSVIGPVKKKVPLKELSGKCLAVDLGFWICEMQFIQHNPMSFQTPYLRTLYFRILNLAQQGIKLIFVIDGPATDLKVQTITKRFKKGSTDRISEVILNKYKVRKTFRSVLKQCTQLLDSLGIPHLESEGEGEKMCALLNLRGVCDGVITNDGDAFLYGAKHVYRNLSLNAKEPFFELYSYEDIKSELRYTREHFIAYALLVGCDYNTKGVPGVGKEGAVKFLNAVDKPLHLMNQVSRLNSSHCCTCRHLGSSETHKVSGCKYCKTSQSCTQGSSKKCLCQEHCALSSDALVLGTLEKCSATPGFPFRDIVKEFLEHSSRTVDIVYEWKFPCIKQFKAFASLVFLWEDEYCFQQAMSICATWALNHCTDCRAQPCPHGHFTPVAVVKRRTKNFETCVELIWKPDDELISLFDFLQSEDESSSVFRTIEREDILMARFPDIINEFLAGKEAKKSKKPPKSRKKPAAECLGEKENSVPPLSLSQPTSSVSAPLPRPNLLLSQPERRLMKSPLKRPHCFSPVTEEAPVCSTPRLGGTPSRGLSPNSYFTQHVQYPPHTQPTSCPSPYLNLHSAADRQSLAPRARHPDRAGSSPEKPIDLSDSSDEMSQSPKRDDNDIITIEDTSPLPLRERLKLQMKF